MAITTLQGEKLFIKIGDGATPTEAFTHPCTVNADRGIQFQSSGNEVEVPSCNNPEDPVWSEFFKTVLSATITGAGKLDTAEVPMWAAWFNSDDAKNIKVYLDTGAYWSGPFKLTDFQITGARKNASECSLTLRSHGAITFNAAA